MAQRRHRGSETDGAATRRSPTVVDFYLRVAKAALSIGLAIEIVGQGAITVAERGLGVGQAVPALRLLFAPLLGASAVAVTTLLLSLPVVGLARPEGRARPLAAAWAALSLVLVATLHAVGLALRFVSGLFPTPATVILLLDSPVHFIDQARASYQAELAALLLSAAALFVLLTVHFSKRLARSPRAAPFRVAVLVLPFAIAPWTLSPPIAEALADARALTTEAALFVSHLRSRRSHAELAAGLEPEAGPRLGPASRRFWQTLERRDAERPNVLLVMLESIPHDHLGFAGYGRNATPNLDRLARESLWARRVWATSTHSNYAQMAILSSLFPRRRTSLDVYRRLDYPRVLPHDIFHRLGYRTATISSQNESWQGMRRFQTTSTPHYFRDSHDYDGPKMGSSRDAKTPDHVTISLAREWLDRQGDDPWYLYINLQRTHYSYDLPQGFAPAFTPAALRPLRRRGLRVGYMDWDREAIPVLRNRYDSALRYVDAQIGRLLAYLERRGFLDETLIVVTSDHGEAFGRAGVVTHGKTLREPEARPFLLLHWAGHIESGVTDLPISALDVMPTILDAMGLPPMPAHQGRSILDEESYRERDPGIFLTMQGLRHADGVVCFPWKYVFDRTMAREHLYDLERDPAEQRDLASVHPQVVEALSRTLAAQISAQLRYHAGPPDSRRTYAPRMLGCPSSLRR